jgi:hypothetical protein
MDTGIINLVTAHLTMMKRLRIQGLQQNLTIWFHYGNELENNH